MILSEILTSQSKNQRGLTSTIASTLAKAIDMSRLLLICLLFSFPQLLHGQFTEQIGQDVPGIHERGMLGEVVKFSGDGTTYVTVEYMEDENNDDLGVVSVYQQQSGTWVLMGSAIKTEDVDDEIVTLAISDDGQTIAIGNAHDSSRKEREGTVKVYAFSAGDWVQQGATLRGDNIYDHFGISIDFSSDATYLVVGANRPREEGTDDPDNIRARAGYVETYKKGASGWSKVGNQLLSGLSVDTFGITVKLSGDASRLFVSNWVTSTADGNAVFTYKNDNDTWSGTGSLDASGGVHGFDIATSSNGEILAIATYFSSSVGKVDVYKLRSDALGMPEWAAMGSRLEGVDDEGFGASIDLTPSGYTLFVGAPDYQNEATDEVGAVKVYNFFGDEWVMQNLQVVGQLDGDDLGHAVSASNDGLILAVGAPGVDANGMVRVGLVRVLADCPAGVTCTTQEVAVCGESYDFSNGTSATTDGRYDIFENPTERVSYLVTFQSTEQGVDVFQNAIIADAGSVTYQANTNVTGVLSFDKSQDQWVNMNALQDDLSGTNRSIFMWVKSEANVTSTHQTLFAINTASGGNVSLLWIDDDSDNLEVNDGSTNQSASFNMNGEVWNYVGYTYDATTNETVVYVNGIENDRYTNNQIAAVDAQYSLGQEFDNSSTGNFYNGDMAEISVWNEVLTGAEIQTAMQTRINNGHPKFANLVGYYSVFGECADDATVLKDHSGNGNDGTFENGMVQDFQNVQNVEGFNSIGWFDHFSWKKDGQEVSSASNFTTDVAAGNYQFIATRNFVQSTDSWTMTLNGNATTVDNIADETLCADDPVTRTVPTNTVNYLDFEETEDNYVQLNALTDDVAGKSRSVFMWFNLESGVSSGNFNELLVFQAADVDSLSRFYIRDTERLALVDGTNDRLNSTTDLDNDTWYFIGYTYDHDAKVGKLYVNGTEEDSGTLDMPLDNGWLATLGAKFNDNGLEDHLDGQMAEVSIWNKVLTPEEITSLMGAAPAHDATNLVAAYGTIKSAADNQLRDLTANGNDGLVSHSTIIINDQEQTFPDYDATNNYTFSWKKGETEFDTDATGNIAVEEGTTAYSVTYGTPLFQKTDEFSLSYTNLIPTQPVDQTAGVTGTATFEVDEIAGATYQWYDKVDASQRYRPAGLTSGEVLFSTSEKLYVGSGQQLYGVSLTNEPAGVTRGESRGFSTSNFSAVFINDQDYFGHESGEISYQDGNGDYLVEDLGTTIQITGSDRTITSITEVDDIIYATVANGGLLISNSDKSNWAVKNNSTAGFGVTGPYDNVSVEGSNVYVTTGIGISISNDGGSTWSTVVLGQRGFFSEGLINDLWVDGDNIYAATDKGLAISADGGDSWTTQSITGLLNQNEAQVHSVIKNEGSLYVGINNEVLVSEDNGATWSSLTGLVDSENGTGFIEDLLFFNGALVIRAANSLMYTYGAQTALANATDVTADNSVAGTTNHRLTVSNLTLDQSGTNYFVVVSKDGCDQTSQSATLTVLDVPVVSTYSPANSSTDVAIDTELSMEFSKTVTVGTGELKIFNYATDALVQTFTAADLTIDGSIVSISSGISLDFSSQYYITLDANLVQDESSAGNLAVTDKDSWSFHTTCEPLILTEPEDQSGIVGGSATFSVPEVAGASYQWFNSQNITEEIYDFSGSIITDIYANESRIHVITDSDKLFTSIDGGVSFTENENITGKSTKVIEFDGVMYVAMFNAGLAISTDNGATFEYKNKANNGLANDHINSIYVNSGILYVSTGSGLSISTDNGESFETRTTNDGLGNNAVYEVYAVGSTVYVANLVGGFGISQDGGKTFTSKGGGNGLTGAISELVVASDGTIYVGGASAFVSKDGGESFTELPAAEQFLSTQVFDLDIEDDILYINVQEESLGAAVYSSADKGNTLTTLSQTDASGYRERTISVLNGQVFAGGYSGTLVKHLGPTPLESGTDATADNYLLGATTATLTFSNLTEDLDQTEYFVVVTKGECEETSETVTLSVVEGISIARLSPENNATDVAIDTDLSITYDLAFTKGTGSLRIRDYATDAEVAAFSVENATITDKTLTFTGISLQNSTQYYITLDEGLVVDIGNNNSQVLTAKDSWSFSTVCEDLLPTQPEAQSGVVAGSATLSVDAIDGASYQWFEKRAPIWSAFNTANSNFPVDGLTGISIGRGTNKRVVEKNGIIYVGTQHDGLAIKNGTNNWVVHNASSGTNFPDDGVRYIAVSSNNTVYAATIGGLAVLGPDETTWTVYNSESGNGFPETNQVQSLSVSEAGTVYVGTAGNSDFEEFASLAVLEAGSSTWQVYNENTDANFPDLSSDQHINDIQVGSDGTIYLACLRDGLSVLKPGATSWEQYKKDDGSGYPFGRTVQINYLNENVYAIGSATNSSTLFSPQLGIFNTSTNTWATATNPSGFVFPPTNNQINGLSIDGESIYTSSSSSRDIYFQKLGDSSWETLSIPEGFGLQNPTLIHHSSGITFTGSSSFGLQVGIGNSELEDNPDTSAGNQIQGATTNTLTINNLSLDVNGKEYFVIVTKGECEETSNTANLSVITGPPSTAPFTMTVTTTEANEEFTIPTNAGLTYNYYINWGDGAIADSRTGSETHAYAVAGSYDVKIYGTFPAIAFAGNTTNARKVVDIKAWGEIAWQTMNGAFAGTNITTLSATDTPDLSNATDLSEMFEDTRFFNSDLSSWNVSTITNMKEVFKNAPVFNGDVSTWDVSNVTTMEGMFQDADAFNQDISGWKVGNVTDMSDMFNSAQVFDQDISGWNVGNVTTMSGTFLNARVFNQDISGWDVSKVTSMSSMFGSARLFDQDISGWNVGAVTSMSSMFTSAFEFNQDLSSWNVENVTSMSKMFKNASVFDQGFAGWDVSNVTNMSEMFSGASVFDGNISNWNVSGVTTMSEMFIDASSFNQDVSVWNVSASLSFMEMFKDATKFDQNLGAWNIKPALEDDSEALGDMFDGTALSTTNYDNTLIGWAAIDGLPDEAYLYDVPATFCASENQRDFLLNTLSWEIDDEGKANNCFAEPDAVTLTSFVPANGATGVSVTSNMALTFSENVQAYVYGETGTAVNDVVLYDGSGNEVERFATNSLTYSAATVTIDPTADLDYSQTYYLLIDADAFIANTDAKFAGVTDVNTIRFTTEAKPNTAPVASAQDFAGTLEVNQELTGSYTYTDADTDAESGTTFQWYVADDAAGANSTAISGATAQNYTLTASEEGKFVSLAITPNDGTDAGTEVFTAYKGGVVAAVIPELVSTVPTDEAKDIVVSNDLSFVLSESVNKGTGNITLTPVSGAATMIDVTSAAVTVTGTNVTVNPTADLLEDQFYTVTFDAAAFVDADGNNSAGLTSQTVWNFTTKEAQVAPVATAVSINKSIVVDGTLEGSYTYSDGNDDPESGSTYQWYRADDATGINKAAITGGTTEDYTAVAADNNKYVSFEVTPNDGNLAGTAEESAYFGPVLINDGFTNIPPAFTSDPLVTLLDNVNYSYTITTEDLNSHAVSLTKTTGPAWLTLSAGVLSGDPAGQIGDHSVVLTADDGNGGTKTQEFTITVEASNTAPSVSGIEVTGTTTIDELLTGSYNFVDAEDDADNSSYKWYRADDNVGTNKAAIAGATTTTYTLTASDAGKFISFEVTPNDSKVDGTLAESTVVGAVAKKTPTLSLSAISKVYGDVDFDLSATTNSSGTITYSFDNDQTSANISGATVTLGNVGTITVDVSLAADAEFQARTVSSAISIDKRAIEVTVTNASKGVGAADPTLAFTVTNGAIVGSDNVVTVNRVAGESVGSYSMTFTDGTDAGNYEISKVDGTFTINPNAITVTAGAVSKTYGDEDPQFTYTITNGALNTGDELMGGISRVAGEDVAEYALENTLYNADYQITFESANLTVSKKDLTATADDKTKFLGEANPELTITYEGFANGDIASDITEPTIATVADVNSPVDTYDITLTGGEASNYNLSLVNGTLSVEQRPFITAWEITSSDINRSRTFFNTVSELTYLYDIDWGDGTVETNQSGAASHTYTTADTYTVKISGQFPQIQMSFSRLTSVEQWGDIEWKSMESAFVGSSFNITVTDVPDLSQVTSMKGMFDRANIGTADLSGWNVSTITDMSEMFKESNFNGDISSWDVSEVTNMSFMFAQTSNFNGNITGWNTAKVTNMSYLFYFANAFNQAIGSWNVSSVSNMSNMFADAAAFNQDLNSWDVTKVTTMENMFDNAELFNGNITGWDVSNVTDMSKMFDDAKAFNQNIDGWNVSNVTEMNSMFNDADAFSQDLNSWNTSKVTTFQAMFQNNDAFNGAIGNWDVSNATRLERMFEDAHVFNQDISNWQPTNADNLTAMFRDARAFNQDIGSWRFPNADRLNQMFYEAAVFNQDISEWETSNIVDMSSMFENAEAFNQDVSSWDVSSVRSFGSMFRGTLAFNNDISGWEMSAATGINSMFKNAAVFNQDISSWTFAGGENGLTSMSSVFENASAFDQDLSDWDVSNITSLYAIFSNSGMSVASYDPTLIGWSAQEVKDEVEFGVEGLQYCAGKTARQSLIDDHNWTIENDSQSCIATVTIADVSGNEDDGDITVTLTSDAFVVDGFTVEVSTADGTATAGTDYTAITSQTITFAGTVGETQTFTISPTVDTNVEANETLTVSMGNLVTGANNTVTITDQTTVTINDDDKPVVAFTATSASNAESTTSSTIEVTLDQAGLSTATVDYTVTGTATSNTDYTLANGTLTFVAGDVNENISLAIIDDAILEGNETVVVTLSNPSGATLGATTVYTYTITDNDAATVTIADASGTENGDAITLTATLDNAVAGGFTVDVSTVDGTATITDNDYTAVTGHTLTFAGTAGETQTFTVSPTADTKVETDETLTVGMSNLGGTNLEIDVTDDATITINNDDVATVAFVTATSNGLESIANAALPVALSSASVSAITVDYTVSGTATNNTDYTLAGGTLTFSAGETNKNITIANIVDDAILEGNETVIVTLSNPSGATLGTSKVHTYTIIDNDAAAVTIADASGNEGNGAITLIATLDNAVVGGFTVDVSTGDGTATVAAGDYTAVTSQTLTFAGTAGETQTFTVLPTDDLIIENDENLTVSLSNLSTNLGVDITDEATVTITNDDFNNFPTDISLSTTSIAENNALDATIGNLATTDADASDSHSYSLVTGTGADDNNSFAIDGTSLKVNNTSFNFEDRTSYSIRVQTDDGGGGTFAKALTITVTNVNESPFTLSLTNSTIDEADEAQQVGSLMTLDPDNGDSFSYTLIAGQGDTHNVQFAISGNILSTAGTINFEDGASRSIRVQVRDVGGLVFEESFTITIEDVVAEPVRDFTQNAPGADVKNVFSPNGDGINETWVIEDLLDNPFNEVKVFAQGGKLIYSKVNYNNDWAGTFRDDPVPDGTYYYEIVIFENAQSTAPARVIKGFLSIIRNR